MNGEPPGCLFETFGPEVEFVRAQPDTKIFTLVDGDTGNGVYACPGWHFVNRLGYFVVEVPWTDRQLNRIYKL